MVQKLRRKLSKEQKMSGIVFTSTLTNSREGESSGTTHIVMFNDPDRHEIIRRLKDDKFFNSRFRYNIIRE